MAAFIKQGSQGEIRFTAVSNRLPVSIKKHDYIALLKKHM